VDWQLIGEIKAVAAIAPARDAPVLTWLRMGGLRFGLLINFHARLRKDSLRATAQGQPSAVCRTANTRPRCHRLSATCHAPLCHGRRRPVIHDFAGYNKGKSWVAGLCRP
jgi:hypothetical protein